MGKTAKRRENPERTKVSVTIQGVDLKKKAKTVSSAEEINKKNIGWNFHRMDQSGSWPCTFRRLTQYREKMLEYEGNTIETVLNRRHCHPIQCDVLCQRAQNRLNDLGIDGDICQLDIGAGGRLWGILAHNIFHLLWIDPNHEVYPTER